MKDTPCDIYNKNSVISAIKKLTQDWFDAKVLYEKLKLNGETEFSCFWQESDYLLNIMANYLDLPLIDFLKVMNHRCSNSSLRIMGYHCTRLQSKNVFYELGVLPLSERIIESFFSMISSELQIFLDGRQRNELIEKIIANNLWKHRVGVGKGPYFLLNYEEAKNRNNSFLANGPEVMWVCIDSFIGYCKEKDIPTCESRNQLRESIVKRMKPLIVHGAIPYDLIDGYLNCCISLIFQSYFNYIDPEEEPDIKPEVYYKGLTIDLLGKTLMPEHIVRIEEYP